MKSGHPISVFQRVSFSAFCFLLFSVSAFPQGATYVPRSIKDLDDAHGVTLSLKFTPMWDGTKFTPRLIAYGDLAGPFPTLPASVGAVTSNFLNSYNSASGVFTKAQPAFSDLSETPTTLAGYGITDGVPSSRTVNGHPLSANVTVAYSELAGPFPTLPISLGPVTHEFFNSYNSATGNFTKGQPSAASLSDATTVGQNLITLANPGAVTFPRLNADNSVTPRTAAELRSDIGAGTGGGDALTTNPLSQFAATTSAQLAGVLSDENGSGKAIFSDGTLSITSGKTLTSSNTLTLAGTDGATLTIGGGGTLGSAAYTAASAYEPSIAAGTSAQYYRGDESWQTLNQAAVAGLTIADSPTFAGLIVTSPRITTGIKDVNNNSMLAFTAIASAVDGFTFTNAATASPATVTMAATGSDTNINVSIAGKGSGLVSVPGGSAGFLPGLSIGGDSNTGFSGSSNDLYIIANGVRSFFLTGGYFFQGSTGRYGWTNSTDGAGGRDTELIRSSAANVGFADDSGNTYWILGSNGLIAGAGTTNSTITGGAGNMTITSGTGNSRTMALRTTTSGGTATTALTLGADQSATFAAAVVGSVQALSGTGAVNLTTLSTAFTSTGAANALTLANGTEGQRKSICHVAKGTLSTGILTPTTANGYTTITFTNAGDSVELEYHATGGWCIIGSHGVTIT